MNSADTRRGAKNKAGEQETPGGSEGAAERKSEDRR